MQRIKIKPNLSGFMEIVIMCYRNSSRKFKKQVSLELFQYYATGVLWLRIVRLKQLTEDFDSLTTEENELITRYVQREFDIPEPIYQYLCSLGPFNLSPTKKFIPEFPQLPTQVIDGHGGWFGYITTETHNLYEEFPCLGVVAEALRKGFTAEPGSRCQTAANINYQTCLPNKNLCGYPGRSCYWFMDAKNILIESDITENSFRETIPNTGFNYDLIVAVCRNLRREKVFNLVTTSMQDMPMSGTVAQIIEQIPQPIGLGQRCIDMDNKTNKRRALKLDQEKYDMYCVFGFQQWKEALDDSAESARSWTCLDLNSDFPDLAGWSSNRNERRSNFIEKNVHNLVKKFEISRNFQTLRHTVINKMKL